MPIIITGDFNLQPDSAVYELITRGRIKYDRLTDKTLRQIDAAVTTPVAGKTLVPSSLEITGDPLKLSAGICFAGMVF